MRTTDIALSFWGEFERGNNWLAASDEEINTEIIETVGGYCFRFGPIAQNKHQSSQWIRFFYRWHHCIFGVRLTGEKHSFQLRLTSYSDREMTASSETQRNLHVLLVRLGVWAGTQWRLRHDHHARMMTLLRAWSLRDHGMVARVMILERSWHGDKGHDPGKIMAWWPVAIVSAMISGA